MIPSGWSSAFPHNGQPAIFSLLQCCPVNPLSRGKDFPSFPLCRGRHTPIFPSPSKGPVLLLLTYLRLCRTNLTLTYHVKFCLPCDVKNCLPNNVKNSLPTNVKISLPYHVKNCLPSHVKKCLTFAVLWKSSCRTFSQHHSWSCILKKNTAYEFSRSNLTEVNPAYIKCFRFKNERNRNKTSV